MVSGRIYDGTTQRESLSGLEAVSVKVRLLDPAIEADGLSTSDIQAGVEAQLDKAGIAVLPEEKDLCLYVTITGYIYKDVCAFFTVGLEFRQPVMLVRDPTIKAVSSTWGVSVGDSAEVEKLQWSIGQAVGLCLSEFVKDSKATPLH